MKTKRKTLSILLLSFQLSAVAVASNGNKDLDYLSLSLEELGKIKISIATGNNTTVEQAPAVASVITAQQIEAMGARTLDEVLETVPGLHVALSGTNRLDSIYSIRGIHTSFNPQVLLLVNGSPIQWPVQGGRPILFRQSVNNIARIEVIRGPGSAIYGADAFSGVINIITKSANDIAGTEAGFRAGSFDYRETWVQTGYQLNNWSIIYNLNIQQSDGDPERKINSDLQTLLDAAGTSASLAPGSLSTRYDILDSSIGLENDNWKINFRAWISDDTGNGAGGAQALDPSSGDNYKLYTGDATFTTKSWAKNWTNSIKINYARFEADVNFILLPPGTTIEISPTDGNFSPGSGFPVTFTDGLIGKPSVTSEDTQLEFRNTYQGLKAHRIRIAFGSRHQSVDTSEMKNFGPGVITDPTISPVTGTLTDVTDTDNVYLENESRTVNYFSIQDEWAINTNWQLVSGVRYDNYSDFGDTTNPRIALVWKTNSELTTKLLYGSAFRAPSFGELGFKNNPSALGNPDLAPEKIDTYEISFNYQPYSKLQTTVSLFSYQAKDLINGSPSENTRDQEGKGLEWELNWEINDQWRISSSYALQESEDSDTGVDIADAPGQQLTLNAYWKIAPQWLLSTQANWVADRKRADGDNREAISDYTLIDMTLKRKNIYKNLDISLGIRNVFDRDAREPSDGTIPGDFLLESRSLWGEVRYQF
ncbi:MAG: TonB-dependent receptor plug domain-containing protein [Cellvibrionaceae bacterium]